MCWVNVKSKSFINFYRRFQFENLKFTFYLLMKERQEIVFLFLKMSIFIWFCWNVHLMNIISSKSTQKAIKIITPNRIVRCTHIAIKISFQQICQNVRCHVVYFQAHCSILSPCIPPLLLFYLNVEKKTIIASAML